MNLKVSKTKFLLICIAHFSLSLSSFGITNEELIEVAKEAFKARNDAGGLSNRKDAVPAFRKPFDGISDDERIKALALYLYNIDEAEPKWSMSVSTTMGPVYVLVDDPDFIKDWSSMREILKNEENPRKFYLLSILAGCAENKLQHDFIAERTHMLFADGRVAKDEGEYTKSYAHDVSLYAYAAILGNLRALGADFEPPPKDLPHEQQALILAKWLKKNWRGCENIEIPSRLWGEESRPRKSLTEKAKPAPSRVKEREQETHQKAKLKNGESRLPWIIAGVFLLGILALLFRIFKGKSTS